MKTILVIEDQAPLRSNIVGILEEEGYNAIGFERGFTGMMWALKHIPDLIICDIMMSDMNGYSVLNELRNYPATAKVPFIFLTAKADKSSIREGMELGADEYLTKPFRPPQLLKAIAYRLEQQVVADSN
jgi:CheY-like chemotaxis protein